MSLPILYSYRRCPYAIRARMALKIANIEVEIREISLRNKPVHLFEVSPKATVPVLVLQDGTVIDQSLDIMYWAFNGSALGANIQKYADMDIDLLIFENDTAFKKTLDAYKYPEHYPSKTQIQHRSDGEVFLQKLEDLLLENPYLFRKTPGFADIAIFPFVRQFVAVDAAWFKQVDYHKLRVWLQSLVESELFMSIMKKQPTYTQ
jgi:glutathione S-transferase